MKICVLIAALAATVLCAVDAKGQSRTEKVFDDLYNYSVAAEISSILFDGATSAGLKGKGYTERTKLFQDSERYFSAKKYYSFNAALVVGKFTLVRFFPRIKPYVAALNFGIAVRHSIAGGRNLSLPQRRLNLTLQF